MNRMKLVLGDWSDDGHGECEEVVLDINYTLKEVQDAYKRSVIQTDIGFSNKDVDINGKLLQNDYLICVEYESSGTLSSKVQEILEQFGCPDQLIMDFQDEPHDNFVKLWFWFVGLSLPNLEYKVVSDDIPAINGYWDENLNATFGYGLFY